MWIALDFNDIDMSANGKYMTGILSGTSIWMSSDYSTTWSAKKLGFGSLNWNVISMSYTGQYQTIGVDVGVGSSYIYIYNDYGNSWPLRLTEYPGLAWRVLAISNNGFVQAACGTSDSIFIYRKP